MKSLALRIGLGAAILVIVAAPVMAKPGNGGGPGGGPGGDPVGVPEPASLALLGGGLLALAALRGRRQDVDRK